MTTDTKAVPRHSARPQLPEEMAADFRQFRGTHDDTYWQFGDRIDAWVVEMAGKLSQARIYRSAALETDQSSGEIRQLHETARSTDTQLREQFGDVLTHSHYRVLRYLDDRAKKLAYLSLCVESADDYGGRPMPASKLAIKLRQDSGLEPPTPTFGELLERAIRAIERAGDSLAAIGTETAHLKQEALLGIILTLDKMAA